MKESKILKTLSYILLPILIGAIILSFVELGIQNSSYYNKEKYFSSHMFLSTYTDKIRVAIENLIYRNEQYRSVKDNEKEIYYINENPYNIQDLYYLIIYKNKALTNVELTSETNTIETIKTYINKNEKSKKVKIINGNIESNSEIIENRGTKYFKNFECTYYTKEPIEVNDMITEGYGGVNYITTMIDDFEIYSSYIEEFAENSEQELVGKILGSLAKFENYIYIIIPSCSVLSILIIIYLIVSIGYKKGENGVVLNDFDKIPLEIIVAVAIAIGGITIIPFLAMSIEKVEFILSAIITAYFMIYVLLAIIINTLVKRIKNKSLLKTTLVGKILLLIQKICKHMWKSLKKAKQTLTYSTSTTTKVLTYFLLYVLIAVVIFIIFGGSFITLMLEGILIAVVLYKMIKMLDEFKMIEKKLKEMYEGNNQNNLEYENFTSEFKNTVTYINDISNGFENAIQDRIKSERLKAELITNVSHDIKTPLTSIINYVDLLKKENIENYKANEYIEILENKSQRLKRLTEDLVEASKVSTGNISLNLEKINIVELIKQATGEFEDKFKKKGLETIIDSKENEINIMADSRYMYRIIENLFSNISKYALENSRVYVDIKLCKVNKAELAPNVQMNKVEPVLNVQNVQIEIKNISKNKLNITAEELMQRFVRGDKSRTTEGSGLGISIAQNLTELQKGKFELKLDGDLFKVKLIFDVI